MFTTEIGTNIEKASNLLQEGNVVAVPTETVYGLAANALNPAAVAKIFEAKNRPYFNPLIIHLASVNEIEKYAYIDEISMQLANEFMPGPLTLLLNKKNIVPDMVTAGSNKVAIRIPDHPLLIELLHKVNFPLAAPSANAFGYVSPVTSQHVLQGLQGKIPYILDGGKCNVGLESTIVEVNENGETILHRTGGLAIETIEIFLGKPLIRPLQQHNLSPQTSGQLKSHYATTTPLIQGNVTELIQQNSDKKVGIISFKNQYQQVAKQHQFVLSKNGSLTEAAQNLFDVMRHLDTLDYDIILAENFPDEGLGKAINDRLKRAQYTQKD
ncbi:MAG: L-threonylcarbamoyladenylate synthase [Bacteroidetes bacterium]|nr:L-threonylcarbamoyladenylate synthase [Bacteroidota bacterium]